MSVIIAEFPRVSSARRELEAWSCTILGVLCFSFTFPMTRLALAAFDPVMIALVRGAGAGSAALACIILSGDRVPQKAHLLRIIGAATGMVLLFPVLVSTALRFVPATHASVVAAILPLLTAFFGVIRGKEVGTVGFWISAVAGSVLIALFCGYRSGFHGIDRADILLLAGFVACSYAYAEGGLLARELGSWRVICWVLVTVLPIELVGLSGFIAFKGAWVHTPSVSAWIGLAYLAMVSQFIGFYFYYKGLGLGGVAKMSQAQLLLPFLAIFASGLVLGEKIDAVVLAGAAGITGIVLVGRWSLRGESAVRRMQGLRGVYGPNRTNRTDRADGGEALLNYRAGSRGAELPRPGEDPATVFIWLLLIAASLASLLLAAVGILSWKN